MSILVIQAHYEGIVFAADRNITTEYTDGSTDQNEKRNKVFNWPNDETLFGSVGAGDVGGQSLDDWLETQRADFQALSSLEEVANLLQQRAQDQRALDEGSEPAEPMIIHLGRFEERHGHLVPVIYYLSNVYTLGKFGYLDFRKEYQCSEQFWRYFPDTHPSEIRRELKVRAKRFNPFWFHQGIDLFTFNVLESAIRSSFKLLCENHPDHDIPSSLADWEKHASMKVLMYGAYFEAFHASNERYVGGGADVISLAWPDA